MLSSWYDRVFLIPSCRCESFGVVVWDHYNNYLQFKVECCGVDILGKVYLTYSLHSYLFILQTSSRGAFSSPIALPLPPP